MSHFLFVSLLFIMLSCRVCTVCTNNNLWGHWVFRYPNEKTKRPAVCVWMRFVKASRTSLLHWQWTVVRWCVTAIPNCRITFLLYACYARYTSIFHHLLLLKTWRWPPRFLARETAGLSQDAGQPTWNHHQLQTQSQKLCQLVLAALNSRKFSSHPLPNASVSADVAMTQATLVPSVQSMVLSHVYLQSDSLFLHHCCGSTISE